MIRRRYKLQPGTPTFALHCNKPQRHSHKLQPAHNNQQNAYAPHSVQASGVFCLDLLTLALCLRAIPSYVAHFTTQVTFATKPFSSSSSSSTQLHRRIPTISMLTNVAFTAVLWPRGRVLQRPLPRPRKPHRTISTVSQCHGMTNIARVTQHYMPLHVLL